MNKDIGKFTVVGNKARREKLSAEMRSSIASNAAKARWAYKKHICRDMCRCRVCGRPKFRHLTKEVCFPFQCTQLPKII